MDATISHKPFLHVQKLAKTCNGTGGNMSGKTRAAEITGRFLTGANRGNGERKLVES
jgi:hypothetical protein